MPQSQVDRYIVGCTFPYTIHVSYNY